MVIKQMKWHSHLNETHKGTAFGERGVGGQCKKVIIN